MNDTNIIPIPAYLHKLTYTGDRSNHRMLCNKLIDILYPELNITEKSTWAMTTVSDGMTQTTLIVNR